MQALAVKFIDGLGITRLGHVLDSFEVDYENAHLIFDKKEGAPFNVVIEAEIDGKFADAMCLVPRSNVLRWQVIEV